MTKLLFLIKFDLLKKKGCQTCISALFDEAEDCRNEECKVL